MTVLVVLQVKNVARVYTDGQYGFFWMLPEKLQLLRDCAAYLDSITKVRKVGRQSFAKGVGW